MTGDLWLSSHPAARLWPRISGHVPLPRTTHFRALSRRRHEGVDLHQISFWNEPRRGPGLQPVWHHGRVATPRPGQQTAFRYACLRCDATGSNRWGGAPLPLHIKRDISLRNTFPDQFTQPVGSRRDRYSSGIARKDPHRVAHPRGYIKPRASSSRATNRRVQLSIN